MTLTLELSPTEEAEVRLSAEREGISLPEYARRRLLPPAITDRNVIGQPFNVMQFAGAAPRTVEEIDAHIAEIEAGRSEWGEHNLRPAAFADQG